jgi:hypothetical protein
LQSKNPCNKYKANIHKGWGTLGIEFTLNQVISDFICNSERINLDYIQSFAKFGKVLQDCLLSNWKQVLSEHFLEQAHPEVALPVQDCALPTNFQHTIDLFLVQTMNKKTRKTTSSSISLSRNVHYSEY